MKKELKVKIAENCKNLGIEGVNSIEDLRAFIDKGPKGSIVERTAFWYLLRDEFVRIEPLTSKRPTVPYELLRRSMVERMSSKLFNLNKLGGGAIITAPDVVYGQATAVLERELLKTWYDKSGGVKINKIDPKGLERIERIEAEYFKEIKAGNTVLGSGRMFKEIITEGQVRGSSITFMDNYTSEARFFLTTQRKLMLKHEFPGSDGPVNRVFGGTVSATTLKELKKGIRSFVKISGNELYWNEVARIIERAL